VILPAIGAAPARAAFPGTNGRLVVTRGPSHLWSLWTENPDGTGAIKVRGCTNCPGGDFEPVWSPNGSQILFVEFGSPNKIGIVNGDGTGLHFLGLSGLNPTWSPDGKKIVYSAFVSPGNQDLFVANADGTGAVDITNTPSVDEVDPAWSPDGTTIAYSYDGQLIYSMNADGSGSPTNLTTSLGGVSDHPAWSPDGTKIAFSNSPPDQIYVMHANGSHINQLATPGTATNPAWSPDGARIAFNNPDTGAPLQVWTINSDGTGASPIVAPENQSEPNWQPISVGLRVSSSLIGYSGSVAVTGNLGIPSSNRTLSIYKLQYGVPLPILLASGVVSDVGDFSVSATLYRTASFYAEWSGEPGHPALDSGVKTVAVKVGFSSAMVGGYKTVSGYRLYHYTSNCPAHQTGCPAFATTVFPTDHGGDCVYFLVQYHNGTGWHTSLHTGCVHLNSSSKATIGLVYQSTSVKGIPFRIQSQFAGDSENAANNSLWHYFKVTS
jgi:dipeptidyl aminopeptidase/acylaminoacyl peptidase